MPRACDRFSVATLAPGRQINREGVLAGSVNNHGAFAWSIAEMLRGDYKQSEYQKVILPLVVIRRLDAVLEPTKDAVLAKYEQYKDKVDNVGPILEQVTGEQFSNVSQLTFRKLLDDPSTIADNLRSYIAGFSGSARDVIDKFELDTQIARLDKADLLYMVIARLADLDLHPDEVSNEEMGYLYEDLIRKFSELSNETAGEHFTPRDVIELMVNLLFIEDDDVLSKPGVVRTVYDPAAGTGGMLATAENHLRSMNPDATLEVFGQELNAETYAVCRSDMMLKGQNAENIAFGNSFTDDAFSGRTFDYMLANPPFGVDWGKYAQPIRDEHDRDGFDGRFGAGLPRKSDGAMLFLEQMISKMKKPEDGGSRIAIVFNGSPLFTSAAGGGESEIRRWIIENDWLEAIVALPEQMFYNTGIATYLWIVTNRKAEYRRGEVQLVDAREMWEPMRKSLGDKRRFISKDQIDEITRWYGSFGESDTVKIFDNSHFGYQRITLERPMRRSFVVDDETMLRLEASKAFAKLGKDKKVEEPGSGATRQEAIRAAFVETSWPEQPGLFDDLWDRYRHNLEQRGVKPDATIRKLVFEVTERYTPDAEPMLDRKGNPKPDSDLRDQENVPLEGLPIPWMPDPTPRLESGAYRRRNDEYMETEVLPWVPDAWVDHTKTKIGYEIPFTREFYVYVPFRPLEEIDAEIEQVESDILDLLRGVRR
jgi:type I restriction enzyme M protein